MDLLRALGRTLTGPNRTTRAGAVVTSQRIGAATSLVSSLEYLAESRDPRTSTTAEWVLAREAYAHQPAPARRALDLLARPAVSTALEVVKAVADLALIVGPSRGRWRGVAGVVAGSVGAALYPQHRHGTDGADQVSTFTQVAMGVAQLSRDGRVADAMLWTVSLQSTLSYAVAGWAKLLGEPWRSGEALPGILRTHTYGHERLWRWLVAHPRAGRLLSHSVLAFECAFPLVYLPSAALTRGFVAVAVAFHVGNGFVMGLGRFVGSFLSMHPALLYTSASNRAATDRDDRVPGAAAVVLVLTLVGLQVVARRRRARVLALPEGGRDLVLDDGDVLRHDGRARPDGQGPVVVLEAGMIGTQAHFAWVRRRLEQAGVETIGYARSGYAGSTTGPGRGRGTDLDERAAGLLALVDGAVPPGRDVVVLSHSLGGEIARRAALLDPSRFVGLVHLDPSHPGELTESGRQSEAAEDLGAGIAAYVWGLRAGLGALLSVPDWVLLLPEDVRRSAFDEYADRRLWSAGAAEWAATERQFRAHRGPLPALAVPGLVLSAQLTVDADPVQRRLHEELARSHAGRARVVAVEGASHDSALTHPRHAAFVADQVLAFLEEITGDAGDPGHPVDAGLEGAEQDRREDSRATD